MEIVNKIPTEIQFNVFKYQPHPVAEILKDKIVEYNKYFDDQVRRCKSLWKWKDGDEDIVGIDKTFYYFWQDHYATKYNEWEQEEPSPISREDYFKYYNNDSD